MKRDLHKNFNIPKNKMTVIHNPVDADYLHKKPEERENNPEKIRLLAIGRLSYEKGFDLLLNAIKQLDEKYTLTILGEGSERKNLTNLIKRLNLDTRVELEGFIQKPYRYMQNSDLLVQSSRYEGFPNVLLEAGACGLPAVAFRCPGGSAEIIEDELNGILTDCENSSALAQAIEKAVSIQWNKKNIADYIHKRFATEKIITQYEKVFEGAQKIH